MRGSFCHGVSSGCCFVECLEDFAMGVSLRLDSSNGVRSDLAWSPDLLYEFAASLHSLVRAMFVVGGVKSFVHSQIFFFRFSSVVQIRLLPI